MKVTGQHLRPEPLGAVITLEPDERFSPRCHQCGTRCPTIHSRSMRDVRDLDLAGTRVTLACHLRKAYCPACGRVMNEQCEAMRPHQRITERLARYAHQLCAKMSVAEVARHLGLDWKTVKQADKAFLEKKHGTTNYEGLRILAVDEVAVKKGHQYMTVVLDYLSGRVVWMGEGRKQETLEGFFAGMSDEQRAGVQAVAMDMWDPFIAAVRARLPHAQVVFDLFHVVKSFGKVIDRVRIDQTRSACAEDKDVHKGSKYLLLRNKVNLKKDERAQLRKLLRINATLCTLLILKDQLKTIWQYRSPYWAGRALERWCALARTLGIKVLDKFAQMLEAHREGILNHCRYPIHTSKLEGVNNKIKVIKRVAYGFHDLRYFELKVKQAFA
jgi:transposase